MRNLMCSAAALMLLSATQAPAAITGQDIVNQFQSSGYKGIEVTVGPTQAKVEAVKDGIKVETVYDLATGDVVKSETQAAEADDDVSDKVEMHTTDKDFSGDGDDDSNDSADDQGDDDNSGSGDDDSGSDSVDDHDGSGQDGGGDHDGGDNGGSDD